MYVDLHGHSRKHNVFMYGCDASYLEGEAEIPENYLNERLFPFLMSMKVLHVVHRCRYYFFVHFYWISFFLFSCRVPICFPSPSPSSTSKNAKSPLAELSCSETTKCSTPSPWKRVLVELAQGKQFNYLGRKKFRKKLEIFWNTCFEHRSTLSFSHELISSSSNSYRGSIGQILKTFFRIKQVFTLSPKYIS